MKKNCPFCNLDMEKTRIIETTKYCHVIFSNPRLMPGHLLVIPKRHVEKLSELEEFELSDLLNLTIQYQEEIFKKIAPGCDIRQNYRPFIRDGDLKVSHLHFHLQPRWPDVADELYIKCQIHEIGLFKKLTEEEMIRMKKLLDI